LPAPFLESLYFEESSRRSVSRDQPEKSFRKSRKFRARLEQ
jgi:hypothetical protein